ncbi:nose resistant to fluoxetine protein 6-like [Saccostrea cucullata]|uniref:nose resistant to fluoxetine protein 6-like n=1 Tax=Saccostrea cuccullata TaxID=36930 RepID=UPI002ED5D508
MALQINVLLISFLLSVCWGALQDQRNVPQYHELIRQGQVKLTQGESEPDFIHRFNGTTILQKILTLDSMYDQAVLLEKEFLTDLGSRIKMSGGCGVGLQLLLDGLKERSLWSLKMLDAIGKVPSGIFDGDFIWPGQYDECNAISQAFTDRITYNETFLVRGKYFVAGLWNPLGYNTTDLRMGVCLPDACNAADVKQVMGLAFLELYQYTNKTIKLSLKYVYHQETKYKSTPEFIAASVICSIIGFLLLLGTLYDMFINQDVDSSEIGDVRINKQDSDAQSVNSDTTHLMSDGTRVSVLSFRNKILHNSKLRKFLLTFSISTNGSKVLNTDALPPTAVPALNGVRVLSMGWVILGHTYFFTLGSAKNAAVALNWLQRWTFQIIINGIYSVDSFFLLSGLLVSYLTLKELQKRDGKLNWLLFYFHRFWRLTPAMMLVILVYTAYFQYWGSGPLWPLTSPDYQNCKDYWWRNLLYIQNFFSVSKECMGWGWYLANDMQFFVLSPFIIYPLYRKPLIGYILILALMVMQLVYRGIMSVQLDMTLNGAPDQEEFFDKMYQRPYARIAPYVIGVLTGYFMWKSERRVKLPKVIVVLGWIIALVCVSSVVFGTTEQYRGHKSSTAVTALYNSLSKTTWSLGLAWIIFACSIGYGGFINTFLSARLWSPLSRLTYCAYLVHPVIMFVYTYSHRYTMYYSDINIVFLFLGFWMATYGVAFFVSMAFEAPMIGLERLLLRKN